MKITSEPGAARRPSLFVVVSAVVLSISGFYLSVLACEMNVREAGFLNNAGGPYVPQQHVLCFLFSRESPDIENFANRMLKICGENLPGSNLDVRLFVLDKLKETTRKELASYGADTNRLPAAVLMQEREYDMKATMTFPGLMKEDDLRALVASPKRLELRNLLSDNTNYCAFVVLPGADKAANAKAVQYLNKALAEHKEQMPKQIIPILTVDKSSPAERLFLAELGVKEQTKDPMVALVFGKGRIIVPILTGADISVESFQRQLAFVNHNASDCTGDAVLVPGSTMDMILPWSDALDKKMFEAIAKSGVVPDLVWNEAVVDPTTGEMIEPAGVRTPGAAPDMTPEAPFEAPPDMPESPAVTPAPAPTAANAVPESPAAALPPPPATPPPKTPAAATPAPAPAPAWIYVFPTAIGILVIVAVVGWLVFFRRRDR